MLQDRGRSMSRAPPKRSIWIGVRAGGSLGVTGDSPAAKKCERAPPGAPVIGCREILRQMRARMPSTVLRTSSFDLPVFC
jgi:hypothetical protein